MSTVTRLARALGSLLVLLMVLVGAPWLLWHVGRLDVVSQLGWSRLLQSGDAGQLLLLVLTALGWASWVFVAATVLSELLHVLSHERIDLPVPGSAWLRPVVAVLVVSVVGLVVAHAHAGPDRAAATGSGASAAPGPVATAPVSPGAPASITGTPTISPTLDAVPSSTGATSVAPSVGHESVDAGSPGAHRAAGLSRPEVAHPGAPRDGHRATSRQTSSQQAASSGHYIVQVHDDLWDLAQRLYGDPTQWRRLATANHIGPDAGIEPGQMLVVPGLDQAEVTRRTGQPAPDTSERLVVVHPGDTLTGLAQQHLGSASHWRALQQANATLVTDPDRLEVGWTLHLPPRVPTASPSSPASTTPGAPATVQPGTTHQHPGGHAGARGQKRSTAGQVSEPIAGVPTVAPAPVPHGDSAASGDSTTVQASGAATPPTATAPAGEHTDAGVDLPALATVLAGLAAVVASGVAWTLRRRRREREFARPLGRRAPVLPERLFAEPPAGDQSPAGASPAGSTGRAGVPVTEPWADGTWPTEIPDLDAATFGAALRRSDAIAPATRADLGETAVVVGELDTRSVVVDLADACQLVVCGPGDLVRSAAASMLVGLATAPWSDGVPVTVASGALDWIDQLDNPLVRIEASAQRALDSLGRRIDRRPVSGDAETAEDEEPADAAETVTPEVWLFDLTGWSPKAAEQCVLDLGVRAADAGLHPIWLLPDGPADALRPLVEQGECDRLLLLSDERALLSGEQGEFLPSLVGTPARRALVDLFDAALTPDTEPAPWWVVEPDAQREAPVRDIPTHHSPTRDVPHADAPDAAEAPAQQVTSAMGSPALAATSVEIAPHDHEPLICAPSGAETGEPAGAATDPDHSTHSSSPAPWASVEDAAWNEEPSTSSAPVLGAPFLLPSSAGRLDLSRRPDTEHPEAAMARIPDVLAHPEHPTLLLLGPVELLGARGTVPSRAVKQCLEYCAWLMQHPGHTSAAMARSLLVAEGTRRSNMSRLRTWLGVAPDGTDYLPDAYSGRIHLHAGVTSDWEHLQLLISAGVNRASDEALVEALELVRGAPLADAAPGQWHWAEELRTEMTQTLRDIAVVLAGRAIEAQDADLARWACCRALVAAPDDELLLCARIRAERLAGNHGEVERLVLQLTRTARMLGVDLAEETVMLMQEVMEGRVRARA